MKGGVKDKFNNKIVEKSNEAMKKKAEDDLRWSWKIEKSGRQSWKNRFGSKC